MDIVYMDEDIIVCVKPSRVLSTDEPEGLPDLLRRQLGDAEADIRTVHRLDRVVSGLMVLARNGDAASDLSRQIRESCFEKTYQAVLHGCLREKQATLSDLLGRDKARKMTFVAREPGKGIQEASLSYQLINQNGDLSRVKIRLHTGRTHQIRVQFASRDHALLGDRKYGAGEQDGCRIALWSYKISFLHPQSGQPIAFSTPPPAEFPWNLFNLSELS